VTTHIPGEQRGDGVDSRLDGPGLARPGRDVDAQARQAAHGLLLVVRESDRTIGPELRRC
jgi:hypothetical protein